jgi:anthranilate phosphoribosyltransferase
MLNAALIFYAADMVADVDHGLEIAANAMESAETFDTLRAWVAAQNRDPETGLQILEKWIQ